MATGVVCILSAIIMSWMVKSFWNSEIPIRFSLAVLIQLLHIFTFLFSAYLLLVNEFILFKYLSFYCLYKANDWIHELLYEIFYEDEIEEDDDNDDDNKTDEDESKNPKK